MLFGRQTFLLFLLFGGLVIGAVFFSYMPTCLSSVLECKATVIKNQQPSSTSRYVRFLEDLLESAEQYFMVGYRVHYYLFTDLPDHVPMVKLGEGRQLIVIKTESSNRWQEISLRRMEIIEKLIKEELLSKADYMFSLDADCKFYAHWGAESLGDLVGVVHGWFIGLPREKFTYERRPKSQAFIPYDEGDYYYTGAVFGGRPDKVLRLVKTCRMNLDVDRANQIEAVWQEESHLNKYFLYNKPTKLLSPEYLWDDNKKKRQLHEGGAFHTCD